MTELIVISAIFGILQIIVSLVCYYFLNKKQSKTIKDVSNHHQFLLKVKNDMPILWSRVKELESQILPPEEHELH